MIFFNSNVLSYKKHGKIDASHPNQPKLMTINVWNEWVEGSYLLTDMKYGFIYLEAVKDVMDGNFGQQDCLVIS